MKLSTLQFVFLILFISMPFSTAANPGNSTDAGCKNSSNFQECILKDTPLGAPCDHHLFEKWGPVHKADNSEEYSSEFKKLIDEMTKNSSAVNGSLVCFHNRYFLQCDVITHKCRCANKSHFKHFHYTQVGNDCLVGENGRCNPKTPNTLVCVPGTKCKSTGRSYSSSNPEFICSSSLLTTPTLHNFHNVIMWILFVGMALLI